MEYPGNYHHNMHGELVVEIMQNIERERSFL